MTNDRMNQIRTYSKLLPICGEPRLKAPLIHIEYRPWTLFFEELYDPHWDPNKALINYPTGKVLYIYRRIVLEQFFYKNFDKTYKPSRMLYGFSTLINLEVDLWSNLLIMLENMTDISKYGTIPEILSALIHERGLVLFICPPKSPTPYTATKLHKEIQGQNKKLIAYKNPFDESIFPETYQIIKLAIEQSEKKHDFKTGFYNPVIHSRMKYVQYMIKNKFIIHINGKPQRQGRRKSPS